MEILDQTICVNLDVHIWQGRRSLKATDLQNIGLPPEELASLGSKKVADPGDLKIFSTLKRKAERVCSKKSVRFLKGYATSLEVATELEKQLASIQQEFEQAKVDFLSQYDQKVSDWVNQFPEWKDKLEIAIVPKHVVEKRFGFDFQLYQIKPSQESVSGLGKVASGLGGQLFREIAKDAIEIHERSIHGQDKVSRKVVTGSINTLLTKLDTLEYMSPKCRPLINTVNTLLKGLPATGSIEGIHLIAVRAVIDLLSDEEKMMQVVPPTDVESGGLQIQTGLRLDPQEKVTQPVVKAAKPAFILDLNLSRSVA
jgi:hypothetical protein